MSIYAVLFVLLAGMLVVIAARAVKEPARWALVLAAITIFFGLASTVVTVRDGIVDDRVTFSGKLPAAEILRNYHPERDPRGRFARERRSHLDTAHGTMVSYDPSTKTTILWAAAKFAPWLLALLTLALAWPIVRATRRGDPFGPAAARRLTVAGVVLLAGIPLVDVLRYAANVGAEPSSGVLPVPDASLTLPLTALLPGLILLVLAAVFRRGDELADFERHAI